MLIGYNPKNNDIEFLFSDSVYLNKMFPNNTAHITNFWKIPNHGLIEIFIDEKDFPDYRNYNLYKIIDGKIVKKEEKQIKIENKSFENKKQSVNINNRSLSNSIKKEVKHE